MIDRWMPHSEVVHILTNGKLAARQPSIILPSQWYVILQCLATTYQNASQNQTNQLHITKCIKIFFFSIFFFFSSKLLYFSSSANIQMHIISWIESGEKDWYFLPHYFMLTDLANREHFFFMHLTKCKWNLLLIIHNCVWFKL